MVDGYGHAPSVRPGDTIRVGVLALQGAFREHAEALHTAGVSGKLGGSLIDVRTVRAATDLADLHGLIIPGGESTTIALLASKTAAPTASDANATLLDHLRAFVHAPGRATWGTCAGMILLADEVDQQSAKRGGQHQIGGLPIRVVRNQWGRQTESFEHALDVAALGAPFPATFIRAPVVHTILGPVDRVASIDRAILPTPSADAPVLGPDAHVVALRRGRIFATAFHPELSQDARFHEYWLRECILAPHAA